MCDCDDNSAEFYDHRTVKGRKPHRCYECRRPIAAGETHDVHSGKWDGEFNTFRWCAHCTSAQRAYEAITGDGCFCFGTLWESIREARDWNRRYGSPAFVRLIVGALRKWTVRRGPRRGELMPVPVVPAAAGARGEG